MRAPNSFLKRSFNRAKATYEAWSDDNCSSRAASLAYFTAFSLAPILVIVTAVASFVFQRDDVVNSLLTEARKLVGADGADLIQKLLQAAAHEKNRGLAAVIAFVTLLVGATTAFSELKDSLDAIWKTPKEEAAGIRALLRARLLSFGLVLSLGFLMLVTLVFSAALSSFSSYFSARFGGGVTLVAQLVSMAVSMGGTALLFAVIFKLLPTHGPSWRVAWHGALGTTVLFLVGRALIGLYLGTTATASSFGAAGSLAVLLVWLYYTAIIFFFGAEYTRVLSLEKDPHHAALRPPAGTAPTPSDATPHHAHPAE